MPIKGISRERSREMVVTGLLSGRNHEEAARAAGVDPRTLRRWLKKPAFQRMLHQARREAFAHEGVRLQQGAPAAVSTLLKTLINSDAKESVRVNVAKFVLESIQNTLDVESLELRISSVEQKLARVSKPLDHGSENLSDTEKPA